ncbi:hypothetical protein JTB14_033775 [Gonioctena quinquepunctata]|nr:hypothetical protein JTB14_033775 [Gonioctena quinquepunctata]
MCVIGLVIGVLLNAKIGTALQYPSYTKSNSGNYFTTTNETFDFIVIGAGPTGSVITNRLTEIADWKVLLIEAGDEANFVTDIPVLSGMMEFTNYNWGYKTEVQNGFCRGCEERNMIWPHGKALGGSTVINYMIHVRGNRLDYDRWAESGNPGWSYKEVLPYFMKSEDFNGIRQDPGYHSRGGYLSIGDVSHRSKSADVFVSAAQEAGHQHVDYNGKRQLGVHCHTYSELGSSQAHLQLCLNRESDCLHQRTL